LSERDRLQLSGMVFFGHHGALPAERELGQDFTVDVTVEGDWGAARRSDQLEDALDYRVVWEAVREIVEGPPMNLLEALADRVARRLVWLPRVERARVAIAKRPPLPGSFQAFQVVVSAEAGTEAPGA
jgi:7,8-dihydroneopterin aldolase/epimerase/oxygenase